jgi:hypothetical protein
MPTRSRVLCALCIFVISSSPLWGQAQPVPIPGGDVVQPFGFFNQFLPGVGTTFDGLDADPHGITNSKTAVAMGYTTGTATDSAGHTYVVGTDIRVYQGEFVGAVANEGAGGSKSAKAHGTFVEI